MVLETGRFRELFPKGNIIHQSMLEAIKVACIENKEGVTAEEIKQFAIFQGIDPNVLFIAIGTLLAEGWLEREKGKTINNISSKLKLTEKYDKLIWTNDSFANYEKEKN